MAHYRLFLFVFVFLLYSNAEAQVNRFGKMVVAVPAGVQLKPGVQEWYTGVSFIHFHDGRFVPAFEWIRHTYRFQYNFRDKVYGVSASAGYALVLCSGRLDFNYRWNKTGNSAFSICPKLGFDIGFGGIFAGPDFYVYDRIDDRKTVFCLELYLSLGSD